MIVNGQYDTIYKNLDGETCTLSAPYKYAGKHYIPWREKGVPFIGCSAGFREYKDENGFVSIGTGDEACNSCTQARVFADWDDDNPPIGETKPISMGWSSTTRVYTVVILAWYHRVPTGRKNRKNFPIYNYEACKGKTCDLCKDTKNTRFFGQEAFIELGRNHSATLDEIEEETIGRKCRCGGDIETTGFKCTHEGCDASFEVDWNLLDGAEKARLLYDDETCEVCGVSNHHLELIACSKCATPEPLSLWDMVLWMERSGTNKETVVTLKHYVPIDHFFAVKAKNGELDEKDIETARGLMVPLDFTRTHPILELPMQARDLGIPNYFADKEPDPADSKEYGDWGGTREGSEGGSSGSSKAAEGAKQTKAAGTSDVFDDFDDTDIPF